MFVAVDDLMLVMLYIIMFDGLFAIVGFWFGARLVGLCMFSCVCCSCGCLVCCFGELAVAGVVVSGLRVALFIWLFGVDCYCLIASCCGV